ncbi:hypothetical protein K6Y31_21245 [Motilimonas cestriensis]|uniref:Uncharacterized protein n=1 Tax=Motilimonas cestriensis TaxID=2742685 RepID=A0ABS8WG21_9GAMM|nr:conjugative transfer protein MobI(A/C) [Motilimonas cestriensis]MCE2597302.1 hypothetical protein [Motilimonas cestriensis]
MNREPIDDNMVEELTEREAIIRNQAQSLIDQYWATWKSQNNIIVSKGDLTELGRYAPIIRKTVSGHVDIDWRNFGPNPFRKKNKTLSNRLKPYVDGYKLTQFTREGQPWEIELINEYLEKINQVRSLLKAIHQSRVIFKRHNKKYNLETQTQPEEITNE